MKMAQNIATAQLSAHQEGSAAAPAPQFGRGRVQGGETRPHPWGNREPALEGIRAQDGGSNSASNGAQNNGVAKNSTPITLTRTTDEHDELGDERDWREEPKKFPVSYFKGPCNPPKDYRTALGRDEHDEY
jgi:hypothetical protein